MIVASSTVLRGREVHREIRGVQEEVIDRLLAGLADVHSHMRYRRIPHLLTGNYKSIISILALEKILHPCLHNKAPPVGSCPLMWGLDDEIYE